MTTDTEQWHVHWHRIREDALTDGHSLDDATAAAGRETAEQFGPEPQEPPVHDTARDLQRARLVAEHGLVRTRAQRRAELLPFGDGYLDDDRPDFHGTNVGLQRHTDAGEPFCPPCAELLDELLAAGLARPLTPVPEPQETSHA